jgi:serine/threonine protein kinase
MISPGAASPILVVDDEELNLRVIGAALKHAGYAPICSRAPSEALDLIRRESPRLILLDLNMPEMDGLTLLGKIRERSGVPVIMVTGVDRSDTAVRALRLGAYDYVTKPIDFRRLLDTIQVALGTEHVDDADRRIDHYQILRELGRGGMGSVHEARDVTLDRRVALKVLLPELAADPFYELMFLREARAAAKVSHPSIVTVFEAGRYRGQLFMAMELVRGTTLTELLESGHPFTPRESAEIGLQCAEALSAAHGAGLIHRDIKPANLMLTGELGLKILDFGLAKPVAPVGKETEAHAFAGTIPYSAPEQIQNFPLDTRCDIFSLGVVLFELLADEHPFEDDTSVVTAANILKGKVRKPLSSFAGVPPALAGLVSRMIETERDRRPTSMQEVAGALRSWLGGG